MSTNRPDFALESYQDKTLPNGKQLRHLGDLAGHTINWLLAALIACALSAGCLLDGPTEVQAMQASAATVADAQLQARQTARFDRAAQRLCAGGGYVLIGRAEIACTTGSGGRRVLSVKVAL